MFTLITKLKQIYNALHDVHKTFEHISVKQRSNGSVVSESFNLKIKMKNMDDLKLKLYCLSAFVNVNVPDGFAV